MVNLAVFGTGEMGSYIIQEQARKVDKVFVRSGKTPEEVRAKFLNIPNLVAADDDASALKDADFVNFCLPTEVTNRRMKEALPYCKQGAIISGETSIKGPEVEAFDEVTRKHPELGLQLVSIHNMCTPSVSDPRKEILAIIPYNASPEATKKAVDFYGPLSNNVVMFSSPKEHDTRVANTQANTSRLFLSIAKAFADRRCFPGVNPSYSDAFDEAKFALAMRVANQPAHVYKAIQFLNNLGRELAEHSGEIERELFAYIIRGDKEGYRRRILQAKEKVFGSRGNPILTSEDLARFGSQVPGRANSHYSLVPWLVGCADLGIDIFEDWRKARTPMYSSLVALSSWLFNTPGELERAIAAPFNDSDLRADDLDYHDTYQGWCNAARFADSAAYDAMHADMKKKLDPALIKKAVDNSKLVTTVCREALRRELGVG